MDYYQHWDLLEFTNWINTNLERGDIISICHKEGSWYVFYTVD